MVVRDAPEAAGALTVDGELGQWLVKGVISTVLVSLGFVMRGLFGRMREAEAKLAKIEDRPDLTREIDAKIADIRLCMAENYVRRDDHVTTNSRIIGLLEDHGVALARLEERIGAAR